MGALIHFPTLKNFEALSVPGDCIHVVDIFNRREAWIVRFLQRMLCLNNQIRWNKRPVPGFLIVSNKEIQDVRELPAFL